MRGHAVGRLTRGRRLCYQDAKTPVPVLHPSDLNDMDKLLAKKVTGVHDTIGSQKRNFSTFHPNSSNAQIKQVLARRKVGLAQRSRPPNLRSLSGNPPNFLPFP